MAYFYYDEIPPEDMDVFYASLPWPRNLLVQDHHDLYYFWKEEKDPEVYLETVNKVIALRIEQGVIGLVSWTELLEDIIGGREGIEDETWVFLWNAFLKDTLPSVLMEAAKKAREAASLTEILLNFVKDNIAIVIIVILLALTAIFAPGLLLSVGKTIYTILEKIGLATAKTLTTINGWISTVKGWLHIEEIGAIMETVGSISRLLETISPAWAANIQKWENEIAKASKSLFGDSNTISAYLIAVQMAVWDISSLAGKSYDIFQVDFYESATAITTQIAEKQELYQNNPGALWYDMQEWFLQPLYGEAVENRRASDVLIGQLGLAADTIQDNLETVDDRLVEYEKVLKPTDLAVLKETVGNIRTSLREEAIEPLSQFKKDVTDIYIGKLPDKSFSQRWNILVQPALDNANILGADETTLTAYQKEQRLAKGEHLLDFISRIARTAWDGVIGGVQRLYSETIGKLDREEVIIPPVLEYTPEEWTLTPSRLLPAKRFEHSPQPFIVPIPKTEAREAMLSTFNTGIQSVLGVLQ